MRSHAGSSRVEQVKGIAMRVRLWVGSVCVASALVGACGDSFGPQDAVGTWDLRRVNGAEVPGDVWIRTGAGDSAQIGIEAASLALESGTACVWTVDLEGEQPTSTECSYTVGANGAVVVTITGTTLSGTGDGDGMTLTDEDENVLAFRRL